uniref:Carboxylic ester hydrolase n=1 Tax=Culex tarsalis TaxID=7177 RepID=A0A1Q3FS88_CULTA
MSALLVLLVTVLSTGKTIATEPCVAKFSPNSYGVGSLNETFNNVSFCTFLGVRYGEPPTGSLRFKNPVLYNPKGPQDYSTVGSICLQEDDVWNATGIIGDEDCLFMNIYSPLVRRNESDFSEEKFPVLVFIHGGSFIVGSAQVNMEHGVDLLIDSGILVVSINYRLGVLGFLRYPEFNITGNFGLKDQRAALRWIQKYIKQFGGDPQRVTLMGHSAGGGSVSYHLYADSSHGLFQQAFVLGGSMLAPWALLYDHRERYEQYLSKLNVTSLEVLEEIDAQEFFQRTDKDYVLFCTMAYQGNLPTLEDANDPDPFITVSPHEQALNYNSNSDIPILMEQTATEFELLLSYANFFLMGNNFPHESLRPMHSDIKRFVNFKAFLSKNPDFYKKLANIANLYYPTKRLLSHLSENNQAPIYYFQFEFDGQFGFYKHEFYKSRINGSQNGVVHGDELSYIFSPYVIREALERREDYLQEWKVHKKTVELVSNFVKYGNPTPKASKLSNLVWPPYNSGNSTHRQYLNIDKTFEIRTDSDYENEIFVMWEMIYECLYYSKCDELKDLIASLENLLSFVNNEIED